MLFHLCIKQSNVSGLKIKILNLKNSNRKSFGPGLSSYRLTILLQVLAAGRQRVSLKKLLMTGPKIYTGSANCFKLFEY